MIGTKKRFERRVLRFPVHLEVRELNGQPATATYVLDISSLGARLETSKPSGPRSHVEFLVLLPGMDKEVRLSGQVMWMRPLAEAPGRFQMGLQFYGPQWDIDRLAREGKL